MAMREVFFMLINALFAAGIAKLLDWRGEIKVSKERRNEAKPLFDIDMDLPPDDGILPDFILFRLINVGVGTAFDIKIKNIQLKNTKENETVNNSLVEKTPSRIVHPMKEYNVDIRWHKIEHINRNAAITIDDTIKDAQERCYENVVFVIEYEDVYENRYNQTLEIEYNLRPPEIIRRNPSKPTLLH